VGQEAPAAAKAKAADDSMNLDEVSVTATREERPTLDVPQAIAVIGKDRLDSAAVFNVKDAIVGTPGVLVDSKNGGYDARLIIRGAGLRASYGIREIMFLRDGVPLTDPDSLTRLDWVDTQDIERIEISKGPGNLYSPGSAGGAVQIFSRSVFDPTPDGGNVGRGSFERWNLHLRSSTRGERWATALSASIRNDDNGWRTWNRFDTK
jgi:iron complex outermembrane receptor protein